MRPWLHESVFARRSSALLALTILGTLLAAMAAASRCAADDRAAPSWKPVFYAFCMDVADSKKRTLPQQAEMLRTLGFEGAGYPAAFGADLDSLLSTLDAAKLKLCIMWAYINVNPEAKPFDDRLPETIRKLKGRGTTLCVLLQGLPPADPRGQQRALQILKQLGDLAAESDLRVSIYHHTGDWTQSFLDAAKIVDKLGHPRVGLNFNLCHWLMVDGAKDFRAVIEAHASKIFAVTINGAKLGSKTWTNGLIQGLDQGDFDNQKLLALVRKIGYRGPIGLMCYGIPGDAQEHLERSMKVWRNWQAQWAKGE